MLFGHASGKQGQIRCYLVVLVASRGKTDVIWSCLWQTWANQALFGLACGKQEQIRRCLVVIVASKGCKRVGRADQEHTDGKSGVF
jgi:hypothetical protein